MVLFRSTISFCGKFLKRWERETTLSTSWETCTVVKRQQLELDMEQQAGSKLGKEYVKAEYCHPDYSTYMQSTSEKCWTGWSTSWNQDCKEKYYINKVRDFIFLGSKITVDGDCSWYSKMLAPLKKSSDQPRQHMKRQRHYFVNKGPSGQGYGFSSGHVWMLRVGL